MAKHRIANQPCVHENLAARIQAAEEQGVIFQGEKYWCKECNKYILLKQLQKPVLGQVAKIKGEKC